MSELKIVVSSSSVPAYVNLTVSNWSSQPITVAPGLSCTPSVFLNCVPDHICLTAASTPQRTTAGQSLRLLDTFINLLSVLLIVWFILCVPVVGRGSRFLCPTPRSQTALASAGDRPLWEAASCGRLTTVRAIHSTCRSYLLIDFDT